MRQGTVLGMFCLLTLMSCNTVTSPEELSAAQGKWRLVELSGTSIPNPDNYTVQFTTEGDVRVQADCNVCNGSYETEGNAISMGPLACTRAFCGPLSLFGPYTAALSTVSSFARRGEELELIHSGGTMTFRVTDEGG